MREMWLEPVLVRHLGSVTTPEELWDRVQRPEAPRSERSISMRLAWAAVCALVLLAAAWGVHGHSNLEFRSGEATEIRVWVKQRTDLDVPLLAEPAAPIRLMGARVVTGEVPTARIAYSVSNRDAVLLVSKAGSALSTNSRHSQPDRDAKVFSWTMRGQTYTLACSTPEDLRATCHLCHAGA
jgi:hypothetical protein